jgi:hypothetical protein
VAIRFGPHAQLFAAIERCRGCRLMLRVVGNKRGVEHVVKAKRGGRA